MTKIQLTNAVERAAELLRDNPDWTYKKAIEKAKEEINNDGR